MVLSLTAKLLPPQAQRSIAVVWLTSRMWKHAMHQGKCLMRGGEWPSAVRAVPALPMIPGYGVSRCLRTAAAPGCVLVNTLTLDMCHKQVRPMLQDSRRARHTCKLKHVSCSYHHFWRRVSWQNTGPETPCASHQGHGWTADGRIQPSRLMR